MVHVCVCACVFVRERESEREREREALCVLQHAVVVSGQLSECGTRSIAKVNGAVIT